MMPNPGRASLAASKYFDSIDSQIAGLGGIADVQQIYVAHAAAVLK